MVIAVIGDAGQWEEIKKIDCEVEWFLIDTLGAVPEQAAAIFVLSEVAFIDYSASTKIIFIHSVTATLQVLQTPPHVLRINGWKSFLARPVWEIAGSVNEKVTDIFVSLRKQYIRVPDQPGFIAARIVAMIINEAWFALGEAVSSAAEIDIAMKSGTNYPYGPFEWGSLIGEKNVVSLLQLLSSTNKRYLPAPLLQQKIDG